MSKTAKSQATDVESTGLSVEELLNDAHRALLLQARFFTAIGCDEVNAHHLSQDEWHALDTQMRVIAGMIKPVIDSLGHPGFDHDFCPAQGGAR